MNIDTKDKVKSNRQKTEELFEAHKATFEVMGIEDPFFAPKMSFFPEGKKDAHIGVFVSELSRGQDIYVEFVGTDLKREDPEKALYRWDYDPDWATQYERIEGKTPAQSRYLIPVSDLKRIKVDLDTVQKDLFDTPIKKAINDHNVSVDKVLDMTLRDFLMALSKVIK